MKIRLKIKTWVSNRHGPFPGPSCARTLCSAQDGGPLKDQTDSRQHKAAPAYSAFSLCR